MKVIMKPQNNVTITMCGFNHFSSQSKDVYIIQGAQEQETKKDKNLSMERKAG